MNVWGSEIVFCAQKSIFEFRGSYFVRKMLFPEIRSFAFAAKRWTIDKRVCPFIVNCPFIRYDYTMPCAIIAFATFMKPAMFAPLT